MDMVEKSDIKRVLEPPSRWKMVDVGALWSFRDLFFFLVWRDLLIRYKQTALGVLWAVLQPLLKLVVFSVVFGRLMNTASEGVPYPVFVFAGLLPWQFFSEALTRSSQSLVSNVNLVTKVYFPRLIIPLAAAGGAIVDFAIAFVILAGVMILYGVVPGWEILMMIPLTFLTVLVSMGVGILLSALTVSYRDFRYVVPFALQIWLFLTPVIYPVKVIPETWRWALALNPMTGVVDGFRSAILGKPWDLQSLGVSVGMGVVVLVVSLFYFRRTEDSFADTI